MRENLVKYFFVGGFCALVDLLLFYYLTIENLMVWFYASAISFTFSTTINYFFSIKFVFHKYSNFDFKKFILVFCASFFSLLLNQAILYLFIEFFKFHIISSKILAISALFILNFSIRNFFIFKEKKA